MGFRFSKEQLETLIRFEEIFRVIPDFFRELESEGVEVEYLKRIYEENVNILSNIIREYSREEERYEMLLQLADYKVVLETISQGKWGKTITLPSGQTVIIDYLPEVEEYRTLYVGR
ncbi:MAG: hypothetical protein QXG12_06485 [Thermoproteota archaeon]